MSPISKADIINENQYWKITPDNNGCGMISLRDDLSYWTKFRIRWIQHITVLEFHRAVQAWLSELDGGMGYQDATTRGNFKLSPKLEKKIHRVFQMKNLWKIHPNSLKVLKHGPLLNEDVTEILVPVHGAVASFVNWIDESPVRKIIGFILPFVMIAGKILGIY